MWQATDNSVATICAWLSSGTSSLPPSLVMHVILSFMVGRIPSQRTKEQQSPELILFLPFPVFPCSNSFPHGLEPLHASSFRPFALHTDTHGHLQTEIRFSSLITLSVVVAHQCLWNQRGLVLWVGPVTKCVLRVSIKKNLCGQVRWHTCLNSSTQVAEVGRSL